MTLLQRDFENKQVESKQCLVEVLKKQLFDLIEQDQMILAKKLMQQNPDLHTDWVGKYSLEVCMRKSKPDIDLVLMLYHSHPSLPTKTKHGKTPLLIAVENGHHNLVAHILRDPKITIKECPIDQLCQMIFFLHNAKRYELIKLLFAQEPLKIMSHIDKTMLISKTRYEFIADICENPEKLERLLLVHQLFRLQTFSSEPMVTRVQLNDALDNLSIQQINIENLTLFLEFYLKLKQREESAYPFFHKSNRNKKSAINKMLVISKTDETITMTPAELGFLISPGKLSSSLIIKIICIFFPIKELSGLRNAFTNCNLSKRGVVPREMRINKYQFTFTHLPNQSRAFSL